MTDQTDDKTAVDAIAVEKPQQKTKGEKFFGVLDWCLNYVVTFVATLGLAYYIRDSSKPAWFGLGKTDENGTKENWRSYTARKKASLAKAEILKPLANNEVFNNTNVASIFVSTVATFPGGFITLPVMRSMERNKQAIVHWYNEKLAQKKMSKRGIAILKTITFPVGAAC